MTCQAMTWCVRNAGISFQCSAVLAKRICKNARNAKVLRLIKDLRRLILVEVKAAAMQRQLGPLALVERGVKETVRFLNIEIKLR